MLNILLKKNKKKINLICKGILFNIYSISIIFLINYFITKSWKEVLLIILYFNLIRSLVGGWHSKKLYVCTIISSIYFSILAYIAHNITYNTFSYSMLSTIAFLSGLYVYKYIPKHNKNEIKNIKLKKYELTIEEKRRYYLLFLFFFIIITTINYSSSFFYKTISIALIAISFIISDFGEKYFQKLEDFILK